MPKATYLKGQNVNVSAAPFNDATWSEISDGYETPFVDITGLPTHLGPHYMAALPKQTVQLVGWLGDGTPYANSNANDNFANTTLGIKAYDWAIGRRWNLVDVTADLSVGKAWEWQFPVVYASIRGWAISGGVDLTNTHHAVTFPTGGGTVASPAASTTAMTGFVVEKHEVGKPARDGGPIPVRVSGRISGPHTWADSTSTGGGGPSLETIFGTTIVDPLRNTLSCSLTNGVSVSGTAIAWDVQCHVRRGFGGPVKISISHTFDDGST